MKHEEFIIQIDNIISAIEKLIPEYMKIPEDSIKTDGNVAVCIIDEDGYIYGKMFGKDKIISRRIFKIAWTKASQVWITSMKTGEYEKLVFNNQIDDSIYGIEKPDLIGWQGGQPVTLKDGTKLSVGFSGFRGISDIEIVVKALSDIKLI
jgi:uncharacterized protein GlcG (DUF336 family)